jgi:hypothetical protein
MYCRFVVALLCASAFGFQQEALTNESVLKMVKAGLSEEVVISMIGAQPAKYSLGIDQILQLKKEGLSDKILAAMVNRSSGSAGSGTTIVAPGVAIQRGHATGATPAAGTEAVGDPNDPLAPHDSGIYLFAKEPRGQAVMTLLEQAAYQGSKTGGVFTSAMTYGIKKAKMKAIIPGPRATIRTSDAQLVFYFYFEEKAAALGKSNFLGGGASNPNQFVLVKLESKERNRETIIGEFGAFGASSGTHEKSMVPFKSERLRAGLYKVVPTGRMPAGEYCFMTSSGGGGAYGAGAAAAVQMFDFGVNSDQ